MAEIPQILINAARHPVRTGAVFAVGALGVAGVAYGPETFGADGPGSASAGAAELSVSAGGNAAEAVPVTDEVLQVLDRNVYNCGGHLQQETGDGSYSVDYAIDYYNSNPDLGKPMLDFHKKTLGDEAFQILLDGGVTNSDTEDDKHYIGAPDAETQDDIDTLLHKRSRVELNASRTYANYSCITAEDTFVIHRATKKPTIAIESGSHVEGIKVNDETLVRFLTTVKKNEDGQVPVDIVDLGQQYVDVNGKIEVQHQSLVVLYADGCDNPILKLTTPKISSPRHPGTTTSSTPPASFVPEKHDDGELPGDGTPASQDPGTPDRPGRGPAGQTPGDDGYLPGEEKPTAPSTSPTTKPYTSPSTGTPPTTGTQPTAPSTPPTTGSTPPDTTTIPTVPGA